MSWRTKRVMSSAFGENTGGGRDVHLRSAANFAEASTLSLPGIPLSRNHTEPIKERR